MTSRARDSAWTDQEAAELDDTVRLVRFEDGAVEHHGKQFVTLGHFMAAKFGGSPSDYGYEDCNSSGRIRVLP